MSTRARFDKSRRKSFPHQSRERRRSPLSPTWYDMDHLIPDKIARQAAALWPRLTRQGRRRLRLAMELLALNEFRSDPILCVNSRDGQLSLNWLLGSVLYLMVDIVIINNLTYGHCTNRVSDEETLKPLVEVGPWVKKSLLEIDELQDSAPLK